MLEKPTTEDSIDNTWNCLDCGKFGLVDSRRLCGICSEKITAEINDRLDLFREAMAWLGKVRRLARAEYFVTVHNHSGITLSSFFEVCIALAELHTSGVLIKKEQVVELMSWDIPRIDFTDILLEKIERCKLIKTSNNEIILV